MNLCNEDHDEICFDVPNCPLCEVIEDKDIEIEARKEQIVDLEYRLKATQNETKKLNVQNC